MLIPSERLIVVNAAEAMSGETPTRRHRFTIAHELGHWICHALADVGEEQPTYCRSRTSPRTPTATSSARRTSSAPSCSCRRPRCGRRGLRRRMPRRLRRGSRCRRWQQSGVCTASGFSSSPGSADLRASRLSDGDRRAFALGSGHMDSAEEDERQDRTGRGERDECSEGPVVAGREGLRGEVSGLCLRDEDRRRDGDADRTADLLARVQQPGCQPGLVRRDADERRRS